MYVYTLYAYVFSLSQVLIANAIEVYFLLKNNVSSTRHEISKETSS